MNTNSHPRIHIRAAVVAFALLLLLAAASAQAADCKRPQGLTAGSAHVINFEIDSAEVPAKEQDWLKKTAKRLAGNPALQVCVIGQADKTGDPAHNRELSLRRAESVAAILKEHGLGDKKFQVIGRGEAFGDTTDSLFGDLLAGHTKLDRRVEVIFFR